MAAGLTLLLLGLSLRRCPRCGDGFFVPKGYRRTSTNTAGGRVNVFAPRCVNCGLSSAVDSFRPGSLAATGAGDPVPTGSVAPGEGPWTANRVVRAAVQLAGGTA